MRLTRSFCSLVNVAPAGLECYQVRTQFARKAALNDDQSTCKTAMSRHILAKNTPTGFSPAAKQTPQKTPHICFGLRQKKVRHTKLVLRQAASRLRVVVKNGIYMENMPQRPSATFHHLFNALLPSTRKHLVSHFWLPTIAAWCTRRPHTSHMGCASIP